MAAAETGSQVTQSGGGSSNWAGESQHKEDRKEDVRTTNVNAAKGLADTIRTALGPKGMDKMVVASDQAVTITNDGATILTKMRVSSPAARMLVELSKAQDVQAGDGTTSVVVLCGAILDKCRGLIARGVHPTAISDAMYHCASKANEYLEKNLALPVDLADRDALIKAASTSLSSKVVAQYAGVFAPMAVDSVLKVRGQTGNKEGSVDLCDIKVKKKIGGTCDDTELVDGLVFDGRASKGASNGVTSQKEAKVGLVQFCISPPKTDMESNVVVKDYQAMDRVLKEERNYILQMVKKIKASGCNVLLIQKSILRDALSDLARHYLAKAKILFINDIERNEIEFISKTLNCQPVANIEHFSSHKLGLADSVSQFSMGDSHVVKVTGIHAKGKTATALVRGSNQKVLDEAERSLHDALCATRCLVHRPFLLPGGGAPEMEIACRLRSHAKTLSGVPSFASKAFADALEVVPFTLAENAGLDPIETVTELRNAHAEGKASFGINVRKGDVTDMSAEHVLQPLLVESSAISLATETVRTIMKIDDIVPVR